MVAFQHPRVNAVDEPKTTKGAKQDIAVALSFKPEQGDEAPKVVASGRGALAKTILDQAFASGVKVREDADLAQLLSAVDVDSVIPLEAFMAVAEILAYVYQANQRDLTAFPSGEGGER
jgi:flagellar biosynthesis protein